MLKVLVIGAGDIGKIHIECYESMKSVNVAGVVDLQEELDLNTTNLKRYPTIEHAIADLEDIDIIDVCLPTDLHGEYIKKSTNYSRNIICEAPLAKDGMGTSDIISYCDKKNVNLFVGHIGRFSPEYKQAKEVIEAESIGDVGVVRTTRNASLTEDSSDDKSGGVILNTLIHDLDFLRWCFGEVDRIFAKSTYGRGYSDIDYALVTLRFRNGIIAHLEGSWTHNEFYTTFDIAGSKGVIEFDSRNEKPLVSFINQDVSKSSKPKSLMNNSPYFHELAHFVQCVESGQDPIVTPNDALQAVLLSNAIIESIKTGKTIHFAEKVNH